MRLIRGLRHAREDSKAGCRDSPFFRAAAALTVFPALCPTWLPPGLRPAWGSAGGANFQIDFAAAGGTPYVRLEWRNDGAAGRGKRP